jgi:hypothetical protein
LSALPPLVTEERTFGIGSSVPLTDNQAHKPFEGGSRLRLATVFTDNVNADPSIQMLLDQIAFLVIFLLGRERNQAHMYCPISPASSCSRMWQ